MKRIATLTLLVVLAAWEVQAQPVRNGEDVIVARDIAGASMTLDGMLNEDVWEDAETIPLVWNGDHPLPGGGQFIDGSGFVPAEPTDPTDAVVYVLRDGNTLWIGAEVPDASIGGTGSLWNFDGLIWAMIDRTHRPPSFQDLDDNNYFGGYTPEGGSFIKERSEFIYGWINNTDTTDTGDPLPGVAPAAFSSAFGPGLFGVGADAEPTEDAWDFAADVDGVANDDNNGTGSPAADVGYTMEITIDMTAMGYDFDQADGDKAPFTVAVADSDYQWPIDEDLFFRTRTYWQFGYAQDYSTGVGYIVGAPGVTVSSGAYEVTEPEFTISALDDEDEIVIDGVLDEDAWESVDPTFFMQWKPDISLLDQNPGPLAPYYLRYFRPDINGDGNLAEVVDPTIGRVKMLHDGNMLYLGLDTDDQAVSGVTGESGDGFRLTLRHPDSLQTSGALGTYSLDFTVDSTGAIAYTRNALDFADAIEGAVGLKGASTAANPFDIDEGYQIEIAIDLDTFGYDDLEDMDGDRRLWVHPAFFDRDDLDPVENSYSTRTWFVGERESGAVLYGYLDDGNVVANEDGATVPGALTLLGNYPNPFAGTTKVRYALPEAGEVRISVYDVLGRRVAVVEPGVQAAGANEITIDATGLASGAYFYQVEMGDAQATGRLMVLK